MTSGTDAALADTELERLFELARSKHHEAVPGLLVRLGEPRWTVRREVIAAIATLGELALPALCESLQRERQDETRIAATADALVASACDVESALIALAASAEPAVAADVAQILGRRRNSRSVPVLIALLHHRDDNVAVAAIEALGRVGGRAAVDALVETVERDYFFRTYPAIDVLGRSGDPRAIAPLSRLLRKPQYLQEAARALGRTADKNAVHPLCELLAASAPPGDANVRVIAQALAELIERHEALYGGAAPVREALRAFGSDSAVRRLAHALVGADVSERIAICEVLGALHNDAASPDLRRQLDGEARVASAAAAALKEIGRGAREQLRSALVEGDSARRKILLPLLASSTSAADALRCLDDPDATVRALACDALARIGDTSVVARLFDLLGEANPRVVQAAISAIQSLGDTRTESLAIAAARSTSLTARRAALRILSYYGYAGALDVFAEAIDDAAAPSVRDVAIAGLAYIEHPRARALLLTAASAAEERVRAAAMRGLGQSPASADVIDALRGGLGDLDAWVRYYAAQALGRLRDDASTGAIAALLGDPAGQVRVAAVEALSHFKSAPALAALREASRADEPDIRRAALIGLGLLESIESLPVLVEAASASEAATRLVALSALSAIAAPETLPTLAHALSDEDEGVRAAAVGLLASWPHVDATRILLDALGHSALRAHILQALGTPIRGRIEGLLHALSAADDELAPAITSIIGRVDPDGASGALFSALQLPNPPARKAAAAMLAARGTRDAIAALTRQAAEDSSDEVRRVCMLLLTQ